MRVKSDFLKKMISILLCIMFIASLCACSGNGTTSSDKGKDEESTSSTHPASTSEEYKYTGSAPISKDRVKISILTSNGASKILGFSDMGWWQEVLNRANVELEMEEIDHSSYADVVKPRLAAAVDLPDIVLLSGRDDDMSYINSGIFIELTDYYEKYGYNFRKQFDEHKNLKAELTTPDGKIYYIPYIYTTSNNSRCLMINKGYADALGMTLGDIQTTDDYYDFLVKIKNEDVNGNGDVSDEIPLFMRAGMIQLWGMFWGLDIVDSGGYQVGDDGKVFCGYADDRYLELLTYLNKLYKEGLLYSEFATANLDMQNALFANNQIGSLIHFISNCTGYSLRINPDWNFQNDEPIMQPLVPPLKGPYGDQHVYGRDALGSFYGITSACKNPETVFCFIDYLYSQEVGELTWYGIEGKDYNIVNGEHVFTDSYLNNVDDYRTKQGYNASFLPSYQLGGGYMAKECNAVRKASEDLAKYVINPSITFSFKLAEENEVLQAYAADLSTYFSENLTAFIMGTRPLNEWDNYIAEMGKMHLSDVIAVHQASIDRAKALK